MPRTYKPSAYAELPHSWKEAIVEEYVKGGFEVDWGMVAGKPEMGWLRIAGLAQRELNIHLNDPLGEPGKQETRAPRRARSRKRVKPLDEHDYLLYLEEDRYAIPDF